MNLFLEYKEYADETYYKRNYDCVEIKAGKSEAIGEEYGLTYSEHSATNKTDYRRSETCHTALDKLAFLKLPVYSGNNENNNKRRNYNTQGGAYST